MKRLIFHRWLLQTLRDKTSQDRCKQDEKLEAVTAQIIARYEHELITVSDTLNGISEISFTSHRVISHYLIGIEPIAAIRSDVSS